MPSNPKNTRKCAACRQHSDKSGMLRVCRDRNGNIFVDESGKADGRGVWVHRSKECLDLLVKKRGLNAAFGTAVDEQVYGRLYELL